MSRQSDTTVGQQEDEPTGRLPRVAVVGRPNVGKSTLVNRILGRRAAITQELPGVTRDRVAYPADWSGRRFELVDTGGWEPRASGLQARVVAQAERAIAECRAFEADLPPERALDQIFGAAEAPPLADADHVQ